MQKAGVKKPILKPKGIPNAVPFKEQMLDEAEEIDRQRELQKKEEKILQIAEKTLKRGINQSVPEMIQAGVVMSKQKDYSKLTPAEIKEAERLMALTGEIEEPQIYGVSRRAFQKEQKKLIDAADVILQVLDARDPESCRSEDIEEAANKGGKKLIQVINKIDLVPYANARAWQRYFSSEFPCVLFDASQKQQFVNKSIEAKLEAKKPKTDSDP